MPAARALHTSCCSRQVTWHAWLAVEMKPLVLSCAVLCCAVLQLPVSSTQAIVASVAGM